MGYNYKSLSYQDVKVGQVLPEIRLPITRTRVVMAASASRDWQPQHHDHVYCQEQSKKKDIFMGVWWYMGMMTRIITDWAGPESFVSSLSFKLRESLHPGDDMRISGKVTGLHVDGDQHIADLDLEVSNQHGQVAPATASVVLPSRP